MASASVSISRAALSKSALQITGAGPVFRLDDEGLGVPAVSWRWEFAPTVPGVHGNERVAGAKEESTLPLTVLITADSGGDLEAAFDELAEALDQWAFTVTHTVDGVSRAWSANAADYARGPVLASEQEAFLCRVVVNIPVYPIPG